MKPQDLGASIENRRGVVQRISDAQSQYFRATGEIIVNDPGEAVADVSFPVYFTGKPSFSAGHQLGPGQPTLAGQLPTCTIAVMQWGERIRTDGSVIYYGATFSIVTTGPPGQVMHVQWSMEGLGLRGPTPGADV